MSKARVRGLLCAPAGRLERPLVAGLALRPPADVQPEPPQEAAA